MMNHFASLSHYRSSKKYTSFILLHCLMLDFNSHVHPVSLPTPSPVSAAYLFFFQAEDGIRDGRVTGVQTCALPISDGLFFSSRRRHTRLTCDWSSDVCSSD